MVQRRTVPCALAATPTAADLPIEVGARTVELLAHRTVTLEPLLRHRRPAWPILGPAMAAQITSRASRLNQAGR